MTDPSMSHADTIREALDVLREHECSTYAGEADAALDALLAVGERDKAEIAALNDRNRWRWPWERARAQRYEEALRQIAAHPNGGILVNIARSALEANADNDSAEVAGERDRQQIARLTEAANEVLADAELMAEGTLYHCATEPMERLMQAVLAGEEDAGHE